MLRSRLDLFSKVKGHGPVKLVGGPHASAIAKLRRKKDAMATPKKARGSTSQHPPFTLASSSNVINAKTLHRTKPPTLILSLCIKKASLTHLEKHAGVATDQDICSFGRATTFFEKRQAQSMVLWVLGHDSSFPKPVRVMHQGLGADSPKNSRERHQAMIPKKQ